MISGMTGYGRKNFSWNGKQYTIVIRSVNHKFLDCVVNLPDGLMDLEAKIKKDISRLLLRGRVTFQLFGPEQPTREPVLNKQLLFKYAHLVKEVSTSLHMQQDIRLRDMISLPDVIYFNKTNEYANKKFLALLDRASANALHDLVRLRKKEGETIFADLSTRLRTIKTKLQLIKTKTLRIINEKKSKLSGEELNEFLRANDINEEISRLEFHINTFVSTLKKTGSLGKVLDFITQEMQREINTLGAKFRDSQVTFLSVIIKDEIEKLREQLQNVE